MKYLIALLFVTTSVLAQSAPAYLKDATITVQLKNGKTYTYSANEYAVVKRSSKTKVKVELASADQAKAPAKQAPSEPKRLKHIISGEVVRSNSGELDVRSTPSTVDVEGKKEIGLGLMYQYNLIDDMFVGGRVDTNGGAGVNIGVGF